MITICFHYRKKVGIINAHFYLKKILIVEDDESIHNVIEELLKENGYNVFNAYSGTEVLLFFEKERYDLISVNTEDCDENSTLNSC